MTEHLTYVNLFANCYCSIFSELLLHPTLLFYLFVWVFVLECLLLIMVTDTDMGTTGPRLNKFQKSTDGGPQLYGSLTEL